MMPTQASLNHFDQYDDFELDTSINDPKLRDEYEAYANGPRHSSGDSRAAEYAAELKEINTAGVAKYRFDKQDELRDVRLGQVMSSKDLLRRIASLIPARYTGQAKHGMTALRVLVPTETGGEWQFVCGVQSGYMPEFSTLYFDAHELPTSEMYRGWRTVLLRLITGGFVEEQKISKLFGTPDGPQGRRYREQLYHFRNRGR